MATFIDGLVCGDGLDAKKGLWFLDGPIERDALEDVGANATCLPMGAAWDELDRGKEAMSAFPHIVVCSADDAWRRQAVHEVRSRVLGVPILETGGGFAGQETIAGLARKQGAMAVSTLYAQAVDIPARGIISLTKIPPTPKKRHVSSGINVLDKAIGGFLPGELSVWTGKRGEGKSTLLGQILCEAVDKGEAVFAFSGELRRERFRDWIYQQFAGPDNVAEVWDEGSGRAEWVIKPDARKRLEKWLGDRFLLVDNTEAGTNTEAGILSLMTVALRQYGCRVFMIDNLMIAELEGQDYFRAQSAFVGKLVAFAKRNDVHVHLVAHPRKVGKDAIAMDDVGGSGDISNRADNAFSLERLDDETAARLGYPSVLTVMKNRETGTRGYRIGLQFEASCRRFYQNAGGTPYWEYKWVEHGFTVCDDQTPFDGLGGANE